MKPLVAVVADTLLINGYHWHAGKNSYLTAAHDVAGVMPVMVPAFGENVDVQDVVSQVHGVMLTGHRSNVHPKRYGDEATARHEPFDEARDATSLPLIRAAIENGIPLFAICRGLQELNVALGGALATEIQEREGIADHREPDTADVDARYLPRHDVHLSG
ncbi:MAG: gamma-glutamyl-gamma-aminobutyrate hydrolase family protein, partial [Pseudomonadota bacterium]